MLDADAQQFETLIAEALRAGPASPAWKQAMELLHAPGQKPIPAADEWTLLVRAREALESGRGYRAIRPGAGFTRQLMQQLDQTSQSSGASLPLASLMMAAAALVIIGVVGIFTWLLLSPAQDSEGRVDLRNTLFVSTLLTQDFDDSLPAGATRIGSLKLTDKAGLRIATTQSSSEDYAGGGVLLPITLPPKDPFAYEVNLDLAPKWGSQAAQVFVADSDSFSADRGISPHELVVHIEGKGSRVVLADGHGAAATTAANKGKIRLRVLVSRDRCLVEQDGNTLYAGEHLLSQDQPRYLGIRLMGKGAIQRDAITIRSAAVRKP